jgi:hypothetical protein
MMLLWPAYHLECAVWKGDCRGRSRWASEKWSHGHFEMLLKAEEAILEFGKAAKVVRGEILALDNGEIAYKLLEPAGVILSIERNEGGPA